LVDGDRLLDMLERLSLGLTPVQTYEMDSLFFDQFDK
jgi:restriction endonuclease Mrr